MPLKVKWLVQIHAVAGARRFSHRADDANHNVIHIRIIHRQSAAALL